MGVLSAQQGMAALQGALQSLHAMAGSLVSVRSELGASPFSWSRLLSRMRPEPDFLSEFRSSLGEDLPRSASSVPSSFAHARAQRNASPHRQPLQSSASRGSEYFAAELVLVAKSVLGSEVGLDDPLMEAGLDSLGSVEFKNAVEARTGVKLPITTVFDYPTIRAMADFLCSKTGAPSVAKPDSFLAQVEKGIGEGPRRRSIVLTSVSGEASVGKVLSPIITDGIRQVPLDKWNMDFQSSRLGDDTCAFGGFLDNVYLFDGKADSL